VDEGAIARAALQCEREREREREREKFIQLAHIKRPMLNYGTDDRYVTRTVADYVKF
jgi:hypothetical protein